MIQLLNRLEFIYLNKYILEVKLKFLCDVENSGLKLAGRLE